MKELTEVELGVEQLGARPAAISEVRERVTGARPAAPPAAPRVSLLRLSTHSEPSLRTLSNYYALF